MKTGVSQGSVPEPLLFLIYINDLPLVSIVFDMLIYADDTTLYCNINQDIGEKVINAELLKLWEWLDANKLSLNIAKTKYMVFHTSKRNVIYPNLQVNNSNIEKVIQFNFLGVILHSHMTWNKHINHISMIIARSIGILYCLRNVYPESVLITIYNTLILPHFHCCLLLGGGGGGGLLSKKTILCICSKRNCVIFYYVMLHFVMLCCIVWFCIVLFCIVL